MAYAQIKLAQYIAQISDLMGDIGNVYWSVSEIQAAVYEALRVWGALTNYWRDRGEFTLNPGASPFFDLSVLMPTLRARTYTLDQIVTEIQYALLENPSGVAGTGMSGQVTIEDILKSVLVARNRFVSDAMFPLSTYSGAFSPPQTSFSFDQSVVFLHRVYWTATNNVVSPIWRDDSWSIDRYYPFWTLTPGTPQVFSESDNAPLTLMLTPVPNTTGTIDGLIVKSKMIDLTNPASTLDIPDEWVFAVKYAALSYLLSGQDQIRDELRAQYCEERYKQAIQFSAKARSVMRVMVNNIPVPLDTITALDASSPYWRNQTGPPQLAACAFDMLAFNYSNADQQYGVTVDVVSSAPIPRLEPEDYIQVGVEELDAITNYVVSVLAFKCGGDEFKESLDGYDSFIKAAAARANVNAAKIRYMSALFGQPSKEQAETPDRLPAR